MEDIKKIFNNEDYKEFSDLLIALKVDDEIMLKTYFLVWKELYLLINTFTVKKQFQICTRVVALIFESSTLAIKGVTENLKSVTNR